MQGQWNLWDGGTRLLRQKELHIQKSVQEHQHALALHRLKEQLENHWQQRNLLQEQLEESQLRLKQLKTLMDEQEQTEGQAFSRPQQRAELQLLYDQNLFQIERIKGEHYLHSLGLLILSSTQPFMNKSLLETSP